MQDFKELSIRGEPERLSSLIKALSECNWSEWHRREDLENRLSEVSPKGSAWYCFSCEEAKNRSAADLWLTNRSESEVYVCNIVPTPMTELGFAAYNQIISDFYKFLLGFAASYSVAVELTGGMLDIREYLSPSCYSLLQCFSHVANKATGSSHPLDQQRWFAFLVQAHQEKSRLASHELYRWLTEEETWSPDVASRLVSEYEKGRALLAYNE
jgi:hypothetical protein